MPLKVQTLEPPSDETKADGTQPLNSGANHWHLINYAEPKWGIGMALGALRLRQGWPS
jgi:hypothetical protein